MCDHHHAARHILCPQCDLLVALPQLEHRQKAVSALRYNVNNFVGRARQRPTAYALVALFMLLLANLFPFI
jgi:paraquat-inducible protein A